MSKHEANNTNTTRTGQLRVCWLAVLTLAFGAAAISTCTLVPVEEHGWTVPGVDSAESENTHELVVVLHGMGRTPASMWAVEWHLQREGYEVLNWGYSSTCCSVEQLGEELAEELQNLDGTRPDRIHFVGHSLGNIIARWVVTNDAPDQPGKMVMIAPPNQGSESADRHAEWTGWLLEPIDELTTDKDSTAQSLEPVEDRPVGIIAGEYDGKVSVEESQLEEQDDHEVVPAAHTFIMNRSDVRSKIVSFLEDGEF